ncbi:MAG: diguanylate cyclase [Oscillospiraceae bacterium]
MKKWLLNSLVILCAIVTFSAAMSKYLQDVVDMEQERVDQIMRESAAQSVALIRERLYNDMQFMENVGRYLGWQDAPIDSPEVLKSIQSQDTAQNMLKNITTATADGNLYNVSGEIIGNIKGHSYFQEAMRGKNVISSIEKSMDGDKNIITVAAPIRRNGQIIGIVNGRFLMTELTKFLTVNSFDGRGYSYISNADGVVFVMADHPDADPNFTSIYGGFKPIPSVSDEELEKMLQNMQSGKEGRIFYEWNSKERTMSYTPIGINDWYFLSVLPDEIVTTLTTKYLQQVFFLTSGLLVMLLALIFYLNLLRQKSRKELTTANDELLVIYNTIPGGIFKCLLDDTFTVTDANDGFYRAIGYTKESFEMQCGNQLVRLMQPEDVGRVKQSLAEQLEVRITTSDEVRFIGANGSVKWLLIRGEVVPLPVGAHAIYCCFTDITELKQTQEELERAKQRYDFILAETEDIVFEWNPTDKTIFNSKMYRKKFGYDAPAENFPKSVIEDGIIHPQDKETFLNIYRRIDGGEKFSTDEVRIRKADGSYLWFKISATSIRDEKNRMSRVVGIMEDIDEAKRNLEKITESAKRDALTGLYNKIETRRLIEKQLLPPCEFAVFLMVDIDNFKRINDTLGHSIGDAALAEVTQQLRSIFRTTDIIGRVGGDEFVVFWEGRECNLEQKLSRISAVFNRTFEQDKTECAISCSIGIALFPRDGKNFAELFRKADEALYFAKQHGKNQSAFYEEVKMCETDHRGNHVDA